MLILLKTYGVVKNGTTGIGLDLQGIKRAAWTAAMLSFVNSIPVVLHKLYGSLNFFAIICKFLLI